jgi:hypothetical protein
MARTPGRTPPCRVLPFPRIEFAEGGRDRVASDAEERPEGVERVEAAVEPEHVFVKVGLQMLPTDAVVDPVQPRIQVGEDEVDDRQVFLGHIGFAALGDGGPRTAPPFACPASPPA